MNSTTAEAMAAAAVGGGCRPLFTESQWQELEHQALIFKYMMAGIPVPPDLLLPIRKSFEAMAGRFYHHPTMGYCSFYGKKLDPEPGRCRRTDGKKWRCSKDAYPDSKYCERHMHRGRNRSRKPVETHTLPQTQPSQSPSSSSTLTSLTPTGTATAEGRNESLQSGIPLHSIGGSHPQSSCSGTDLTQLQMDHGSYPLMGGKDYRYLQGVKAEDDDQSFFSGATANARGFGVDSSSLDNTWRLMSPNVSSFPISKGRNGSVVPSGYTQLHPLQDLGRESINSLSRQQHCFFGHDFGSSDPPKQDGQSLRPFFDEWPKQRDSWSELEDSKSNRTSFSTTQLSISIPMASSDFSTTSSRSPNGSPLP